MKTLFTTAPDEKLSSETVENFCKLGISESTRVEYKVNYPSNLPKSVAAFANTFGGMILIGVETDDGNRPLLPLRGIESGEGLTERIYQSCVNAIHPPVFPNVWLVTLGEESGAEQTRCIVVIRVEESDATPHAVENKEGVYFRTGNVSHPFRRASVDEIQELLTKRKAATERRNCLIGRFRERFEFFKEEFSNQCEKEIARATDRASLRQFWTEVPTLEVTGIPLFPRMPLATLSELRRIVESHGLLRVFTRDLCELVTGSYRPAQESLIKYSGGRFPQFLEINPQGLCGYSECDYRVGEVLRLWLGKPTEQLTSPREIDFSFISSACLGILLYVSSLYESLRFWGTVSFSLRLTNTRGRVLLLSRLWGEVSAACPDNIVQWTANYSVNEMRENLKDIYCQSMEHVRSAFGDHGERTRQILEGEIHAVRKLATTHPYIDPSHCLR